MQSLFMHDRTKLTWLDYSAFKEVLCKKQKQTNKKPNNQSYLFDCLTKVCFLKTDLPNMWLRTSIGWKRRQCTQWQNQCNNYKYNELSFDNKNVYLWFRHVVKNHKEYKYHSHQGHTPQSITVGYNNNDNNNTPTFIERN